MSPRATAAGDGRPPTDWCVIIHGRDNRKMLLSDDWGGEMGMVKMDHQVRALAMGRHALRQVKRTPRVEASGRMGCLMRHMLDTERRVGRAVGPGAGNGCAGEEEAAPAGVPRSGEADDEPAHPCELFFSFSSFRFNARRRA